MQGPEVPQTSRYQLSGEQRKPLALPGCCRVRAVELEVGLGKYCNRHRYHCYICGLQLQLHHPAAGVLADSTGSPLSFRSPVPLFTYATATAVFCDRISRQHWLQGSLGCDMKARQTDITSIDVQRTFRPKVCTDCFCKHIERIVSLHRLAKTRRCTAL